MTSTTSTGFDSLRKTWLQDLISQAMANNDCNQLSALKAQLVHRYGIQNLYELERKAEKALLLKTQQVMSTKKEIIEEVSECKGENSKPLFIDASQNRLSITPSNDVSEYLQGLDVGKSFLENPSECPLDQVFTKDDAPVIEKSLIPPLSVTAPPPPSPALNRLRRWLPSLGEGTRKAS